MLQALIFDVDGTLSETEETHRAAFNRAFEEAGLGWAWDQSIYRKLLDVTGGKERIRYFITDFAAPRTSAIPVEGAALTDWIAALHARKTALYNEAVDEGAARLRPGVEALIRHAKSSGVRLAIATTTSLPNVESLIRATLGENGLSFFETIAAGDMVKAKKPASDAYDLALERLGLAPEAGLALEDSVNGLLSARAARLPVVVTTSIYTSHQTFADALITVPDLDALAADAARTPLAGAAIFTALQRIHHENPAS
jgi:HAD superfamily hydrolase (TIGR01509 family)